MNNSKKFDDFLQLAGEGDINLWPWQNSRVRFTVLGVLLGVCFPVFATVFDIVVIQGWTLSLANIFEIQAKQPLHWIIDTAPFFLGMALYFVDQQQYQTKLNEKRYSFLAENMTDVIWVMDEKLKFSYCSPSVLKITGYSSNEYVALLPTERYAAESLEKMSKSIAHEIQLLQLDRNESRKLFLSVELIHKNGNAVWAEISANIFFNKKTNSLMMIGVSREITERQQAEASLQKSEERFRAIFEHTSIGLYQTTPDGRMLMANPALLRMLGFSSYEELAKENLDDLSDQNSYQRIEFLKRIERDGQVTGLESSNIAKDGTEVITRESARAIRDAEGKTLYYYGALEDITERVRAKEALAENEKRFGSIFQNAQIGLYRTTLSGEILMANNVMVQMLGYESLEDLLARDLTEDAFELDYNRQVFLERIEQDGRVLGLESAWRKNNGDTLYIRESATAVYDEDGNIQYYDGAVEDMTEQKHAAEENEQLELQLQQAQKMDSIGRLAGGVAHDFNNLLSVILGYSELLQFDTTLNDGQKKQIQQIYDAGQRAKALTQQLLTFSRKQVVRPRQTDLNEQIKNALKMYRRLLGEDIEVVFKSGEDLPAIMADPQQLDQILANLLINSRDAIRACTEQDKSSFIGIETSLVDIQSPDPIFDVEPGYYLNLAISDTGIGMDDETREKIFEPFFTTKAQGQGTGLGLSTVYGIIGQNKCMIHVYSELGQGTTFKIFWPVMQSAIIPEVEDQIDRHLLRGSENLLLVEDEIGVRDLAFTVLSNLGYQVTAANSGEQALELLAADNLKPDILVTDVVLPGINGKQLADKLQESFPNLPVLYTSGYTYDIISQQGILSENIELLEKPYSAIDLSERIRKVL